MEGSQDSEWTDLAAQAQSADSAEAGNAEPVAPSGSEFSALPTAPHCVQQHLEDAGLTAEDARSVVEALGATRMEDLCEVTPDIAKLAVASLKLIPAKRAKSALMAAAAAQRDAGDQVGSSSRDEDGESKSTPSSESIDEYVAIAIDHSGSMGCRFDEQISWNDDGNKRALEKVLEQRSRMEAVKQIFYAYRDRTQTLTTTHELGLIQFDSRVDTILGLTPCLDQFESIVDDITKRGSTAIYSAIIEGCEMLSGPFKSSPHADLRVLCLTDGQNNSGASPDDALRVAYKIGAVIDAIIVGDTPDENLRKIVAATGGSCFQIKTLAEGFELMECEAVVSLRARRGGREKPPFQKRSVPKEGFAAFKAKTIVRGRNAAKIQAKPQQAKNVVKVEALFSGGLAQDVQGKPGVKRIMKELRDMAKREKRVWMHSGKGIQIFPDADNVLMMKVLITGPAGSPFEGGLFALNVNCPRDYPFRAPEITFVNIPYHCNVSDSGKVCLEILNNAWSPSLSIPKAVEAVRIMLGDPDTNNALRQWIAELTIAHRKSGGTDSRYVESARRATRLVASRTEEEWKQEWKLRLE